VVSYERSRTSLPFVHAASDEPSTDEYALALMARHADGANTHMVCVEASRTIY